MGDYCPLCLPRDLVQVTALFWALASFSAKQDHNGALGSVGECSAGHICVCIMEKGNTEDRTTPLRGLGGCTSDSRAREAAQETRDSPTGL